MLYFHACIDHLWRLDGSSMFSNWAMVSRTDMRGLIQSLMFADISFSFDLLQGCSKEQLHGQTLP